ncbi:MAG: RICIN domain-containing protein [Caldilineaceae bacterium]
MSQPASRRIWLFIVVILVGALLLGLTVAPPLAIASPPDPITAAWEQVRAAGSYQFDADVTQLTVPVAKVTNVGRTSRTEQLHLEGQTDLRAQSLQMHLWSDGGSVLQTESGVAVKVENGKTQVRVVGGEWRATDGFADALAPQGDFLAYLQAVRNVQAHEPETRAGISFTRYSFTVDGPVFAAYVRDQMAAAMRAKGELPNGVTLDVPTYYSAMTGDGELWVGSNGLPLRQILNLDFPEQRDQTFHAQIVVDFSHFGASQVGPMALLRTGDLAGLLNMLPGNLPDLTPLGLLLALFALAVIVVHYRRSRTVYAGLVTAIILSMVVGPILTTLKLDAFFAAQRAKAAAQNEAQATADAAQEAAIDWGRPAFNPHVNPLESANRNLEVTLQSPTASLPAVPAAALPTDTGVDTDQDGLSDFGEQRVGTDPNKADTDEDGISDTLEVKGFTMGGQTWYPDALAIDSNNDGIGDGQEWDNDANGLPDDTDGDGLPDIFDPDNDADGVPDRLDTAPFKLSVVTLFSEANPLKLTLNNLSAGKPTFVDFQLRPDDPKRLWYAFNVLDWPRNDNAGQVQDIDGKTYADLAASQGRTAGVNETFGDMKLIPMLEIRVPNASANLPSQSDLTPYNISVSTLDAATKVVYVPLTIITDEQTGQRVAFTGRMYYSPTGSWSAPHEVRLVWAVQTLNDLPCDPKASNAAATGCAADGYIHNVGKVVQSYYDNFILTGMNVSEQRGTKTALIYEDPAVDKNLKDDVSLASLTLGLDNSFLAGRDQDNNGQRDVTINDLLSRVDHTKNGALTSDQRWGLDGVDNNLSVDPHNYDTFDKASISTAMTDTTSLLTAQFNAKWTTDNTIKPTILYAYEQQSRGLGLDATLTSGNYMTFSSTGVTVDMQPSGQPAIGVNTQVGIKWTHYCRASGASSWSPCASDDYWRELDARYGNLPLASDPAGADIANGSMALMQFYNVALTQGVNRVVQTDNQVLAGQFTTKSDSETAAAVRQARAVGNGVKLIPNLILTDRYLNNPATKAALGKEVHDLLNGNLTRRGVTAIKNNFRTDPKRSTGLSLATGALITGLTVGAYFAGNAIPNRDAKITLRSFSLALQTYTSLIDPVMTVLKLRGAVGSVTAVLRSGSEMLNVSRTANTIGAVVAIAVVWGFFAYSMIHNHVSAFSPEFNQALAQTIAATIFIIVLTILSATVVGLILVGIVALIDGILTAVCELGGDDKLKNVQGQKGSCFTLGGAATKYIAYLLYNYDLMIDTKRPDMVSPGAPNTQLTNPAKGFVTGNELSITMPITTHVVHKNPDPDNGLYINAHLNYFSPDNLRSSTFKYTLTQPNAQDISGLTLGQMTNEWQRVAQDHKYGLTPMYGGYANTTPPAVTGFNLQPGLNRAAIFYLNSGYAIPAYECWGFPSPFFILSSVCYTRSFQGNSSTKIDSLRYDIFPKTIDGFMTLGGKPDGGRGLSWDASFPGLRDSDGDGLLATAFGGIDPNDATWDNDNDGLSDSYELERRAAGVPYSPIQCDSDGDGLTDKQEAQFGSNPAIADTDNDGLTDGQEVWHQVYNTSTCQPTNSWSGGWNVTVNAVAPNTTTPVTVTIRVSSDPTSDDSDGDGVSDLAEKQLAQKSNAADRLDQQGVPYNPIVVNSPPISIYTTADKRFVAPGQSLTYTTTMIAHTALAPSVLDVVAPAALGASPAPYALAFNTTQTVTQQTNFTAQPGSTTQVATVVSTVRARLASTQTATLQWDAFTPNPLGATSQPGRFLMPMVAQPDRQDTYLVGAMTSTSTNFGGDGQILVNAVPGGQANEMVTGAKAMGITTPDLACNNRGRCLVVWNQLKIVANNGTSSTPHLFGAIVGTDGKRIGNVLAFASATYTDLLTFQPVVASDGADFLVVSEMVDADHHTSLLIHKINDAGNVLNEQKVVLLPNEIRSTNILSLDLVWIGSRYRLAWKKNVANTDSTPSIYGFDIDKNGNVSGNINVVINQIFAAETARDTSGAPALAYDPVDDRTLLIYQHPNTDVQYVLFQGTDLNNKSSGVVRNNGDSASGNVKSSSTRGLGPQLAYNPMAGGWLLKSFAGSLRLTHLFKPDLTQRLIAPLDVGSGGEGPVACPAVSSLPVTDLRFEELPGATTFSDSSGKGNNATCANCPSAGVVGAVDSSGIAVGGGAQGPSSDYAVAFNGDFVQGIFIPTPVQNHFSFTFWYKSPASSNLGGLRLADTGGSGAFFSLSIFNPYTELTTGSTILHADRNLNDGAWHFVAATRDDTTGRLSIYIDGDSNPAATVATSDKPFPRNPLLLRSARPASIDQFRIYALPLSGSMVQAIYNRTLQSYCVGVGFGSLNSPTWAKLNLTVPDTRGGKIAASGNLTITIDADKPTSSISGLSLGQYIQGNTVRTIGGTASDALSGVAKVEIDVARSPSAGSNFQPVSGAESWAYNLTLAEGLYRLQTRATDSLGNVETPTSFLFVNADGTPPTVVPTNFGQPARDANNLWTAFLLGQASDPTSNGVASGLPTNGVEVLLQGQGDAQGNGWQAATLNGSQWTINYAFAPGVQEPTGIYTVSVRAVDNVGNRTVNNAVATWQLDGSGPTAALSNGDATRAVITDTITLSGVVTDTGPSSSFTFGVSKLEVAFVPVDKIAALPNNIRSADADAQLNRTWLPTTLTTPGAQVSAWRITVPAGLESEYQIDLRATDKLGNVLRTDNVWRGVIDTLAPRIAINGAVSTPWFNPSLNKNFSNISVTCTVDDRYVNESSFTCPANGALPVRRFNTDPNLQALFPDRTILNGLTVSNTYATDTPNVQFVTRACDGYGHCSTASINQPPACYWIENKATSYVLDISGANTSLGAAVIAYPKNSPTSVNQLWYVTNEGYIQSKLNGYVLDVLGFNQAAGAPVGVWARNVPASNNQQWNFVSQANGYITIQSRFQNYFLDTASANVAARAVMQPLGNPIPNNQLWRLVQAPAANCGSPTVAAATTVAAAAATVTSDDTVTAATTTVTNGAPTVAIVTPGAGNTVDARGNIQMSVAAQADQPLKELAILLDNTLVKTIPFVQTDAIIRTVQTAAVAVATSGQHTLAARATDWSGAQSELVTVAFVADRQPPTVNLAQTVLTKADSYGPQSNILRFRGATSDDATLIAVQVKVGDQPYADAIVNNGQWRLAYPVTDPEGKQLAVKVRALDAAGNVTEISQTLGTDLSVADAPDTTLGEKPADPSSSTSASFSFAGSATAIAFKCQLDDAPAVPCASPWAVNDLSNGRHTVKVAAIDSQGFQDLSPASYTWNVNVTTLATTLTAKPEATTTNRSASFSFAATGASSFACSLDSSSYAACASPKSYEKLGNGNHTFLVRAKTGSTNGPATRYVWRVTNAAPTVVGDQVLMVVENGAVSLVLQSNDSDDLSYQIVEQPQHGLLLGLAPNLTYVPNPGYAGPDRFIYRAWDGEASSAPATVNITVRLGRYAVFAQEGVAFDQNSTVVRGDVGVNVKSAGPFLRNNVEASFSQNAKMQDATSRLLADSIVVDNNGVIYNPSYNDLTGRGLVNGTRTTPLPLPLRAGLPALPTIAPGAQNVTVTQNGSQTLAAGNYGALTVNNNGTLVLSGGLYHFASWTVNQNAKVHFAAPSEVRIAGAVTISQNAFVGPQPGATSVNAHSIVLAVAGVGGQSGPGGFLRSVAVEQNAILSAYVVAPNGLINFRQNVNATGAFIGKWVLVEQNTKVTRPSDSTVAAAGSTDNSAAVDAPMDDASTDATPTDQTTVAMTAVLYLPLVTANDGSTAVVIPAITTDLATDLVITGTEETAPLAERLAITSTLPATTTGVSPIYLPIITAVGQ